MKEEEALVRVVRVVCGSRNSKGVSVVGQRIFNRETRENREQKRECPQEARKSRTKRECPQEASPPLSESSAERDLP